MRSNAVKCCKRRCRQFIAPELVKFKSIGEVNCVSDWTIKEGQWDTLNTTSSWGVKRRDVKLTAPKTGERARSTVTGIAIVVQVKVGLNK